MTDRVINLRGRGARGESFADVARRTGAYGVDPTDTDAVALAKYALGVALEAGVTAEADRAEAAADFAEGYSGPVYADVATGEAATTEGQIFRVSNGDGPPETTTAYRRTAGGSVAQSPLATTAALASTEGAALVGLAQGGTVAEAIRYVTPEMFGAAADGATDDLTAITAAAAYVAANPGTYLQFNTKSYAASNTVDLSSVPVVRANRAIIVPLHDGVAVQYLAAAPSRILAPRLEGDLKVQWDTSDFTKDRTAFLIQNVYGGYFEISWGSPTRGLVVHGNGTGCVYNRFFLGELHIHNVGITLSSETASGWPNANEFHGGRFYGGADLTGSLYVAQAGHIYIDDSLYDANGNRFIDNSLEWVGAGFKLARMGGDRNRLSPKYCELDSGDTTWIVDTGTENLIDVENVPYLTGYDPKVSGASQRIDVSGATRPIVLGPQGYKEMQVFTQNYRTSSLTAPAIRAMNSSAGGHAIEAQNTNAGGWPAFKITNPDGVSGVEMSASGQSWKVKGNSSGTINKRVAWAESVAPASGTWMRGDLAFVTNPSSGGNLGWVCVASGSPGTWVPFGIVDGVKAGAVSDPAGGATVDAECRAQLAALIDSLQAAKLMS